MQSTLLCCAGSCALMAHAEDLDTLLNTVGEQSKNTAKQAAQFAEQWHRSAIEIARHQSEEDLQRALKTQKRADDISARANALHLENERKQRELAALRRQELQRQNQQAQSFQHAYQATESATQYNVPLSTSVAIVSTGAQADAVKHRTASALPQCVDLDNKSNSITDFIW